MPTYRRPSRAGVLTGRYQQRNGYECNLDDRLGLGIEESTVADLLKSQGYTRQLRSAHCNRAELSDSRDKFSILMEWQQGRFGEVVARDSMCGVSMTVMLLTNTRDATVLPIQIVVRAYIELPRVHPPSEPSPRELVIAL